MVIPRFFPSAVPAAASGANEATSDAYNNYFFSTTTRTVPAGYGSGALFIGYQAGAAFGSGGLPKFPVEGATALGYQAGKNWQWVNGAVAIGYQAAMRWQGLQNCGSECGNFIAIGPFAGWNDPGTEADNSPEFIAIGNKAYNWGSGEGFSVMIGAHITCPSGGGYNVYLGSNNCDWPKVTGNGPFQHGFGDTYVGAVQFSAQPSDTSTYNSHYQTIVGFGSGTCFYGSANNTIVGALIAYESSCTAPFSGQGNVFVGAGQGSNYLGAHFTGGNQNIIVTGVGYLNGGAAGGGVTSGNANSVFGPGAGAALGSANDASIFGDSAAPKSTVTITAFGAQAAASEVSGAGNTVMGYQALANATSSYNTALGFEAGSSITGNGASTYIGYQAGYGDTSSVNTYVGFQAGDRNTPSNSGNVALGFRAGQTNSGSGNENSDTWIGYQANCNGCINSEAIGEGATLGPVAAAAQIGQGINIKSHSLQFNGYNFLTDTGIGTFAANTTVGGQKVCLANGVNCPSSASPASANGSAGSGQGINSKSHSLQSTSSNILTDARVPKLAADTTIGGQHPCLADGTNCPSFTSHGSLNGTIGPAPFSAGQLYAPVLLTFSGTLSNVTAAAGSYTCSTPPTLLLVDCGTSEACDSPTTLASVSPAATNTIYTGTIDNSTLTSGHYLAWQLSVGACTSLQISASAGY